MFEKGGEEAIRSPSTILVRSLCTELQARESVRACTAYRVRRAGSSGGTGDERECGRNAEFVHLCMVQLRRKSAWSMQVVDWSSDEPRAPCDWPSVHPGMPASPPAARPCMDLTPHWIP